MSSVFRLSYCFTRPIVLVLGLTFFMCTSCNPQHTQSTPPKHVILISLDTTRPDHFGCYDNNWIKTPCIDRLADESIQLMNYNTVVTTTLASHVSLFTGKYPHSHGTPRNGFMVNRQNEMLTEILKKNGYMTAGFLGSFALDSRFDFNQGFDVYDENFNKFLGQSGRVQNERSAENVTSAVIKYLDSTDIPDHLFLFIHYFDPHAPYQPPAPFDVYYRDLERKVFTNIWIPTRS